MQLARIHQYLSMAMPFLWMRQADTIGALGLALNACAERDGAPETTERIEALLETRVRALAVAAGASRTTTSALRGDPDAACGSSTSPTSRR